MSRFPVLVLSWLLGCGLASAQEASLYEGEAPVGSQSADERVAALPRALAQVLVKVSGDPAIATSIGGLSDAASLMQRYRYRQDTVMQHGVPTMRTVLIAQFDPVAVEAMIGQAGHAVWPAPRPKPLLWLAIDDGRGARLVGAGQASAVAALVRRGSERGLGFSFPQADLQDQTAGGASAVWRGDFAGLRSAAARYGAVSVLVGKMQRGASGWTAEWTLLDGDSERRRWTSVDADAAAVLAAGADGAATTLARAYLDDIMSGAAGDYEIQVLGLETAEDFGTVLQHLQGLPIVQSIQVREASADSLQLTLSLRAGIEGLVRLVERGGVLIPSEDSVELTTRFRVKP